MPNSFVHNGALRLIFMILFTFCSVTCHQVRNSQHMIDKAPTKKSCLSSSVMQRNPLLIHISTLYSHLKSHKYVNDY